MAVYDKAYNEPITCKTMPKITKRVKYIRTEKFRNRKSAIEIDFYEHGMAEVNVSCKTCKCSWSSRRKRWTKRWRNHDNFTYIPFDECKMESMWDYIKALQVLDRDKVARRWFIRRMRHCTDGLLRMDGRPDIDAAEKEEDRLQHRTELKTTDLDEAQKAALLEMCPEAGYNEQATQVHIGESFPIKAKNVHPNYFASIRFVAMPTEIMLDMLEKLFPQFYETVKRDRDIHNCNANLKIYWHSHTEVSVWACVQDNDFIVYSKHA